MAQTKLGSFTESMANIAVGFTINYVANLLIFPLFGLHISLTANIWMGLIYTGISLARSYVLRRWFNGLKFGNAHEPDDMEHDFTNAVRGAVLLGDGTLNPRFRRGQP